MNHVNHPKHRQLLVLVGEYRFITTHQLARLTSDLYGSNRSALRQTLRHLRALKSQQLITRLERRVGGWQGGSEVSIWTLTTKGRRVLTGSRGRLRPHHHSTTFLEHCLAVAEVRVVLHESAALLEVITEVQAEPDCWRRYLDPQGFALTLKPDLSATVMSKRFVDRYFMEVDRATENPARVIRKCWQYVQYRHSGMEQDAHGVYPAVVWLVPSEHRQQQITDAITAEPRLPDHLFQVLSIDELGDLIGTGPTQGP